jgi:hypothetical protein
MRGNKQVKLRKAVHQVEDEQEPTIADYQSATTSPLLAILLHRTTVKHQLPLSQPERLAAS